MEIRETTYTVYWKYFEVGEKVIATSSRCPLKQGVVYTVSKFVPPLYAGDTSTIFVQGRERGIDTEYITSFDDPDEESNFDDPDEESN